MTIEKYISPLIASQFPSFYKEDGPNFIAFVKAYYEWAESTGQYINYSRNLYNTKDIDTTSSQFVKYFKNKYIQSLPENILADKKLLVKHILELYRSKGSLRAYELLFRLLFNEDIELYIPGKFIFKPSDATWSIPKYIEVSDHPLLSELVGKKIYSKSDVFAIVEEFFVKIVNNKTVNVLTLSNLNGNFKFNEQIYCDDIPEITSDNAPIIFGSLSSITITNGGSNFNVGEYLNVTGGGSGGIARVAATRDENGKVDFTLINGGHGFSTNATVTVTGGAGAGASFKVGGIVNKQIYQIVRDKVGTYYSTSFEDLAQGMELNITSASGTFTVGEKVTGSANTIMIDVSQLYLTASNNESFSNSALSISSLVSYRVDSSLLTVTGPDNQLTNANLVAGVILVSNTTNALVRVNNVTPKRTITSNGIVYTANTSNVVVNQVNGYFVPYTTITGNSSGHTANVTLTTRLTDWQFPYAVAGAYLSNLDTSIEDLITTFILEAGTIAFLTNVNPGSGYSSNPTISIIEPDIYDLRIPNDVDGFLGFDATVTGIAGSATGIATAIEVVDSGYGYNPEQSVYLSSTTNETVVSGITVVDLNGVGSGHWTDNKSFLSDTMAIQDSYYYQDFSYEIIAPRMKNTYEKFVKDLVHPSGMALFGKYSVNSKVTTSTQEPMSITISQS